MSFFKELGPNFDYDNTWVTTYPIGEDYVIASEFDIMYTFDPVTLDTKDKVR